jgi:hypothetical protein
MGGDPGTQNNTNSTITEPKPKQNLGKPELPGKPEVKSRQGLILLHTCFKYELRISLLTYKENKDFKRVRINGI